MADAEQLDETTVDVEIEGTDQPVIDTESEAPQEFDVVLAGQDEAESRPEEKSGKDFILNRVMRKKEKLTDENAELKRQLELAQHQPQAPAQVQQAPDEYDEKYGGDRQLYLRDFSLWQQQMLGGVVDSRLNQQQNGHRIAAQQQQQDAALTKYAENAAKLNVPDFNAAQDKAFDILGDEFAQMLASKLPEDAPKLMYWFSKNPQEAAQHRENYNIDPGNATFSLGKLAGKLTIQPKRSTAAQPETKIESGAVGGINEDWQKQLDQADDEVTDATIAKNLNRRREIKAKARAAGFDVSTLK